jgi:hypothetical protein
MISSLTNKFYPIINNLLKEAKHATVIALSLNDSYQQEARVFTKSLFLK